MSWLGLVLLACSSQRGCQREREEPGKPPPLAEASASASAAPATVPDSGAPREVADPSNALSAVCDADRQRLLLYEPRIVEGVRKIAEQADAKAPLDEAPDGTIIGPGDAPLDCKLGEHLMRAKLGAHSLMPYGWCGADPVRWVSVWLDKVKVLSSRTYAGRCDNAPLAKATLDKTGVTWCKARADRGGVVESSALDCSTTRWSAGGSVDEKEYPPPGVTLPKAGDIIIEYAEDRDLCEALIAPAAERRAAGPTLRPPPGTEVKLRQGTPNSCFMDVGRFDIDNDGATDHVYRRRCLTGAQDGDEYYTLVEPLSVESVKNAVCEDIYAGSCPDEEGAFVKAVSKKSRLTVPEAWQNTPSRDPTYGLRHRKDPALSEGYPAPGKRHYIVTLRYLHLTPFRHEGVTYLLSSPPEHAFGEEDTYFVLRPGPKGPPQETCVFYQVQENF